MRQRKLGKGMLRFVIFAGTIVLMILGCVWPWLAVYPAAWSPLLTVTALLGGQVSVALLLVVPCVVRRRFFCRTVCPLGACFSVIGSIRRKEARRPRFLRNFPKIGAFLALLTLLGSAVGSFGFLWLDPLVLFASPLRGGVWLLPVLGTALTLSWLAPTLWCRVICPLGGMQDVLSIPKSLMTKPKTVVRIERRRHLLRLGIFAVLFAGAFEFLRRRTAADAMSVSLRPPGAVSEPFFQALCSRCGTCVQVCPTKLLTVRFDNTSVLNWGTPRLHFDPGWCRDDCIVCTQACPSGALKQIALHEKKIGLAVFEFEFCRLYEDIECTLCGRNCPFEAISYEWSEEEYRRIVRIDAERCTGCGRCIVTCPIKGAERPLNVV